MDIFNSKLTIRSQKKLQNTLVDMRQEFILNDQLKKLLGQMLVAFTKKIRIQQATPMDIRIMQTMFVDFDRTFNNVADSKFQSDVKKMDVTVSYYLFIGNDDTITINFLLKSLADSEGYIAAILHATHTFCHLFPYSYNNTTLYICLDENNRDLVMPGYDYNDIFRYLHKESLAFNVSGITNRFEKKIILTKREEIVKLLYHEMIHLIGLDHLLVSEPYYVKWAITKPNLNISEAYTEFMAVILTSAYQAIHLAAVKKVNVYQLYGKILVIEQQYSVMLMGNILKFYGYNSQSMNDFFQGIGTPKSCPILIWEYVFPRAQLMLNLDSITNLIDRAHWQITTDNKTAVVKLMEIDNRLLKELSLSMNKNSHNDNENVSYLMIDLDWNLV